MSAGKILFIDAYDSFSNNIISLLKDKLPVTVESIHIDEPRFVFNDDAFLDFLQHFDAVVAGPGPGHPANAQDIGLIAKLWTLDNEHQLPVLGICLGFQSLCLAYGATVGRLKQPRHGLVTPITHRGGDVFRNTGDIFATQYHSLHVSLGQSNTLQGVSRRRWSSTMACPELLPLAQDLSDAENGPILMAVKHRGKPFTGVQYHPESVCTNEEGHKLVARWWDDACRWNREHECRAKQKPARQAHRTSSSGGDSPSEHQEAAHVNWTAIRPSKAPDAASIVQALKSRTAGYAPILLESGTRDSIPVNPETGRFSIIGLHDEQSLHIRYSVASHTLSISHGEDILLSESLAIADVMSTLEHFIADRRATDGPVDSPFWGGLIGFMSYEVGLETIDVAASPTPEAQPDIWFVLVERSVVIDHVASALYIQTLRENDRKWLASTKFSLARLCRDEAVPAIPQPASEIIATLLSEPQKSEYCQKVEQCQDYLRSGSSYELCLTDQTHIRSSEDPWPVYCRLRSHNPAPFGAYLDLAAPVPGAHGITVLSSSPERFLSWSRSGQCQFRPIKGTVKKSANVTREDAEQILGSAKEKAENLMIVDLIRHDLSGVPGYAASPLPLIAFSLLTACPVSPRSIHQSS